MSFEELLDVGMEAIGKRAGNHFKSRHIEMQYYIRPSMPSIGPLIADSQSFKALEYCNETLRASSMIDVRRQILPHNSAHHYDDY